DVAAHAQMLVATAHDAKACIVGDRGRRAEPSFDLVEHGASYHAGRLERRVPAWYKARFDRCTTAPLKKSTTPPARPATTSATSPSSRTSITGRRRWSTPCSIRAGSSAPTSTWWSG